jgi:2-methylcitrate dehydratase
MNNQRPEFDRIITTIAHYALKPDHSFSACAYTTAYHCFIDSIACALMALEYPACTKLLGSYVPGLEYANGCPIMGLNISLDPIQAAFNLGAMVRWLDFNDTWLAKEWGHPSDNLGAILAVADYMQRQQNKRIPAKEILTCMIIAYEVQGILALENSFNAVGLDHVILVKIASTAVSCRLLDLSLEQTCNALSHAWLDGQSLRTYRHAPNTGSRKSWAAGDATSRAVRLAFIARANEMGYPSAITAPRWGFQDCSFDNKPILLKQQLDDYVMENILWKISFPAEFHAQTAVECALQHHENIKSRLNEIERIEIQTQEAGMRIINKTGPLHNPADRDHCLQYMVAIGLLFGELTAQHYEDNYAKSPSIDALREKMQVSENPDFTRDYFDADKRSISNSIQIYFKDGSHTECIRIDYPIGHRKRREEGVPVLLEKFKRATESHYTQEKKEAIHKVYLSYDELLKQDVLSLNDLLSTAADTVLTV